MARKLLLINKLMRVYHSKKNNRKDEIIKATIRDIEALPEVQDETGKLG